MWEDVHGSCDILHKGHGHFLILKPLEVGDQGRAIDIINLFHYSHSLEKLIYTEALTFLLREVSEQWTHFLGCSKYLHTGFSQVLQS